MKALKACSTRLSTNNNIDYRLWYLSSSSNSSSRERRSGDLLHRWASSLSFWTQDRSSVVLVLRGWSTGLVRRAGPQGLVHRCWSGPTEMMRMPFVLPSKLPANGPAALGWGRQNDGLGLGWNIAAGGVRGRRETRGKRVGDKLGGMEGTQGCWMLGGGRIAWDWVKLVRVIPVSRAMWAKS